MYRGWETIIASFVFGSFLSYVAAVTIAVSSLDASVSAWTSQVILMSYLGASLVGALRVKVLKHDWRHGGFDLVMASFSAGALVTFPLGTWAAISLGLVKALLAYPAILGAKIGVVLLAGR